MFDVTLLKCIKPQHTEKTALSEIERISLSGNDISMGADIEFLWLREDRRRNAFMFEAHRVFAKHGAYGTDGRNIIAEMRFPPAYDVRKFTDIVDLTMQLCKAYVDFCMTAKSSIPRIAPYGMSVYSLMEKERVDLPESIGMHIHFGNTIVTDLIIHALDTMLYPVIKLMEPSLGHVIRTKLGYYGSVSDYRGKDYGGFEYRSLPCFIDNKDVFMGAFALAKALVAELKVNPKGPLGQVVTQLRIKRDCLEDVSYLKTAAAGAYYTAKRLCPFYHVYGSEIDKLFDIALGKDRGTVFSGEKNVFENWETKSLFEQKAVRDLVASGILLPITSPVIGYAKSGEPLGVNINDLFISKGF